jgi:hypothetical protein
LIADTREFTAPPAANGRIADGLKPGTTPGTKEPVPLQSANAADEAEAIATSATAAKMRFLGLRDEPDRSLKMLFIDKSPRPLPRLCLMSSSLSDLTG